MCLLLIGVFSFFALTIKDIIGQLEGQVEIEAFLLDDAEFDEVQKLHETILSWEEVKNVEFISKEEALKRFKKTYKNRPQLWEYLKGNPLPASFEISLNDPQKVSSIAARFEGNQIIDELDYGQKYIEQLFAVTSVMRWVGLSFILLLAFASLSMIMITIRLAIFSRRNEIAIMKLVGASNWFVRIPFILEGMIEGFLGSTITIVIIYIVRTTAFEKISDMLGFIQIAFSTQLFIQISVGLFIAGITMGSLGSTLALRRFLKV